MERRLWLRRSRGWRMALSSRSRRTMHGQRWHRFLIAKMGVWISADLRRRSFGIAGEDFSRGRERTRALEGKKLIAHRVRVAEKSAAGAPSAVDLADHRLLVACAQNTWIEITELQMEGKKRMATSDFLRGAGLHSGMRLG